jgi:hypothetical protein
MIFSYSEWDDLSAPERGDSVMKKLLIAVAVMLSLAGPAFAQGGAPPGVIQQPGTHAFLNTQYEKTTVFSKLFGHKSSDKATNNTNILTPTNGS